MNARSSIHPSEETLSAFGLGKLDDRAAEEVGRHLEQCSSCRHRVAGLSADSFLGRIRDARDRSVPAAPVASSLAGLSMLSAGPDAPAPPGTSGLPPGLADHPDYKVVRELGQGGMGVVYLAENTLMGRKEVLKVVSSHLMKRPGVLERFLNEIRHAAQLHHPNVVTAYSVLRLGESLVLAMEYVDGLDMARLVKSRGALAVANACNYVHQAALGLQHAHEAGMVHRDIKPSNLMLSRLGNRALLKVLDFGLAKVIREAPTDGTLTHEGQLLGTPDFIAPEQITDARRADIRADIYSLGCTFYYLLAGKPPFQANSLYEVFQAHHSMDAMPLNLARPEVPVELAALVSKMMAKEPDRRYQEPGEVARLLKPFFRAGSGAASAPRPETSQANPPAAGGTSSGSGPRATRAGGAMPSAGPEVRPAGFIPSGEAEPSSDAAQPGTTTAAAPVWGRRRWMRIALAATCLFALIALGIVIYVATDKGQIMIIVDGPQPIVKIDNREVRIGGLDRPLTLRAGPHDLAVHWGDGESKSRPFTVHRGQNGDVRIDYEQKPAPIEPPAPPAARWVSLFNG